MRDEVQNLTDAIRDETDLMEELIEVVRDQREALKGSGRPGHRGKESGILRVHELDDLMTEMREIAFDIQAQESLRDELAKKLAARLGCGPHASSLVAVMEPDEKALFNISVDKLTQTIFTLKAEMMILSGLIEHNEKYAAMLLSEWHRVMGEGAFGPDGPGMDSAADFRG